MMLPFVVDRREITQRRVAAGRIVEAFDELEDRHPGLGSCERKRCRSSSSHSSVAKRLSHIALSQASPTEPVDGLTPASVQRLSKASEVYWADSSGRRNGLFLRWQKQCVEHHVGLQVRSEGPADDPA